MPETDITKQRLRVTLRGRRNALAPATRRLASELLCRWADAIPGWEQLQHLAGYVAADAEIDPAPLLQRLHDSGKTLYLPVIQDCQRLQFARWTPGDTLRPNRYGIPEPLTGADRCDAGAIDAILMPLVAWNRAGQRLGMGGGFYDRSLADHPRVLKVGLAYELQEFDTIPREPWDICVDYVVTEAALHHCGEGG